jgi:hypothetical protein
LASNCERARPVKVEELRVRNILSHADKCVADGRLHVVTRIDLYSIAESRHRQRLVDLDSMTPRITGLTTTIR